MRHYSKEDAKDLNAEPWQIELVKTNPFYCSWGPHEDYMIVKGDGWNSPKFFNSWSEFGPWGLDELNECVNFYFQIGRETCKCASCNTTGYAPEAKILYEDWYDFEGTGKKWVNNITDNEIAALWKAGRLKIDFKTLPTAEQVNEWSKSGFGHDEINRSICIKARCKLNGFEVYCPDCNGNGYQYITEKAHLNLILWILHLRKGCSRGIEIKNIQKEDLPAISKFLIEAKDRNKDRFSKVKNIIKVK